MKRESRAFRVESSDTNFHQSIKEKTSNRMLLETAWILHLDYWETRREEFVRNIRNLINNQPPPPQNKITERLLFDFESQHSFIISSSLPKVGNPEGLSDAGFPFLAFFANLWFSLLEMCSFQERVSNYVLCLAFFPNFIAPSLIPKCVSLYRL